MNSPVSRGRCLDTTVYSISFLQPFKSLCIFYSIWHLQMQLSKVDGMGVADIYLVIIIGLCRAFYHYSENFIKFDPAKIKGFYLT